VDVYNLPAELVALLRREGLYSSQLGDWRTVRKNGEFAGLTPRSWPAGDDREPLREIVQLRARVERAEALWPRESPPAMRGRLKPGVARTHFARMARGLSFAAAGKTG
jgi:hypothetical protein